LAGARAIVRRATLLVLVAGCFIAAGLAAEADSITARFFAATPGIARVLQSFAPAVPAIAVGIVAFAGLQAMQDVRIRMTLRYGLDPLLRFGFGAVAYVIGASVLGAVAAVAAASVATALAALAAFHRLITRRGAVVSPPKAPAVGWVALLNASWPMTLASLCDGRSAPDTLLLLSLAGAHQVGLYSAAQMTAAMISILLMVVETIMSPLFADRIASTGIGPVIPLFRLSLRWVTLLAVPGFLFSPSPRPRSWASSAPSSGQRQPLYCCRAI
jgi:O-antigen/teichoic acid export membrane protein